MLLGDLLRRFEDEASAEEALLAVGDLALLASLQEQARASGIGIGALAAGAVRRYSAQAPDEEWITLMGALSASANPAATCLRRAVAFVSRPAVVPAQAGTHEHRVA
jgi:hypothetical protein